MDQPEQLKIGGALVRILVPSKATAGLYTICEVELEGDRAVPRHSHSYEDLFLYVVEGEFEVETERGNVRASIGASLSVPRQSPYSLRVVSGEPGKLLVFAQPGGLDLLFRDAAAARQRLGQSPLLDKHGILTFRAPPGENR